jgi:hypothetical protein
MWNVGDKIKALEVSCDLERKQVKESHSDLKGAHPGARP